ncbi:hypothetical protein G9A89_013654 [Geosiphon pyriformis]|nr:hypothetical protein G9A89_013654 [Geosiphon pyriformis]
MFKIVMLVREEEEQDPISQENQNEWDLFIPSALLAYWTMKQDTIQATPFELVYGRTATLPVEIENGPFHIEKILGNEAYKLRWDNKILAKAAHMSPSTSNIPQLGV